MHDLASDGVVLRKRLGRLLRRQAGYGAAASSMDGTPPEEQLTLLDRGEPGPADRNPIELLQSVGRLALIGGAVRDVARDGVRRFRSDLDFVLYEGNELAFLRLMDKLGGIRNRFGGYRLQLGRRRIDVWALEHTWARTVGLRKVETLPDLLECTFFDWDAVLYDLHTRRILAKPEYFAALRTRVLDVNLLENPNPTGSLVRALRRGALWQVAFGPELTSFVRARLQVEAWSDLVSVDERAFGKPILRDIDAAELRARLNCGRLRGGKIVTEPFGRPSRQPRLPMLAPETSRPAKARHSG